MKLLEAHAKQLLAARGIATPVGRTARTVEEAVVASTAIGPCVIKAQIPAGGRGKAGGVVLADSRAVVVETVERLLGSELAGHRIESVLVEQRIDIARELYLAITIDTAVGKPMIMASPAGGIEIESNTGSIANIHLDPGSPLDSETIRAVEVALGTSSEALAKAIKAAYATFVELKAILVEINPLVVASNGDVLAVDAKIETDDSAEDPPCAAQDDRATESQTPLEAEAAERGLRLIELGGNVAILANGAGLTMTSMDAVAHHGGRPANFLEIGGDAYTLARPALELTLRQDGVRSLLVNFCGAFARCDVMTEGVVNALLDLQPDIEVFFSIHGTGQDEARAMVRDQLGIETFESMDDAVAAAVAAATAGDR